jgi:hypothetical protein
LSIRWPLVEFVLTLYGSLPDKGPHVVRIVDRFGHWHRIGATLDTQPRGNKLEMVTSKLPCCVDRRNSPIAN